MLWVDAGRVYLACADSIALDPGTRLTFRLHGEPVAEARLERLLDGRLIAARLTSVTGDALRKPAALEVRVSTPRSAAARMLRVGIPAGGRASLIERCASPALALPPASIGYRAEPIGDRKARLVLAHTDSLAGSARPLWPDTLLVLPFEEATDEEIALERGEIDVGVFWPGEPSSAFRQRPLGQDMLLGTRAGGGLAIADDAPDVPPHAPSAAAASVAALQALNRELFRGDLLLTAPADSGASLPVRYRVDTALPGHAEIERVLNSRSPVAPPGTTARRVRMFDADSLERDHAPGTAAPAQRVLRVRCPVVCAPELRAYIRALGADVFAELPSCATREATR